MPSQDAELIQQILQDTNRFLDRLERRRLLWADVDNHIAASHIAEYLGDFTLVPVHMQAVARLLAEIQRNYPLRARKRKRQRPIVMKASRLRRISCQSASRLSTD